MISNLLSLFPEKEKTCSATYSDPRLVIIDPGERRPIEVQPHSSMVSQSELLDVGAENYSDLYLDSGLTLINPSLKKIDILAIDKCLFQDNENEGMGRCEGAFAYENNFCWFEIKNQDDWNKARKKAYRQIEDTINYFAENAEVTEDNTLYALVVLLGKRRRPASSTANEDKRLHFLDRYGITLLEGNQVDIPIKI